MYNTEGPSLAECAQCKKSCTPKIIYKPTTRWPGYSCVEGSSGGCYWWWESVEMGRKFAMTSFLAFIYPEELEQIATGALITFIGLVVNLKYTPFITDGLNSL